MKLLFYSHNFVYLLFPRDIVLLLFTLSFKSLPTALPSD